jgi:hypothetical protein
MPLNLDVTLKDGKTQSMSVNEVMNMLHQAGYGPKGVSADGTQITMQDDAGDYTLPIQQVFQNVGASINTMKPADADESAINALWRYGVESLPDDPAVRSAFLKSKLEKEHGIKDANIVGSGSDWYVYNQDAGKWMALTSGKGLTKASFAGAIPTAARLVGSTLGGVGAGALGLPSGPGAIAATAVGSGMGGTAAAEINRLVAGAIDPDIRSGIDNYRKHNSAADTKQAMIDFGLDSLGGGLTGVAGKIAPKILANGAVSNTVRGVGRAMTGMGNVARGLGRGAENSVVGSLMRAPITGEVEGAAILARTPDYLARKVPEFANKIGKKLGASEKFLGTTEELLQPRNTGRTMLGMADNLNAAMNPNAGVKAIGPKASDVLGNVGQKIGENTKFKLPEGGMYSMDEFAKLVDDRTARFATFGEKTGAALQGVANAGKTIENGLDLATKGVFKGVRAGGTLARSTGRGMQTIGAMAQPWENRMAIQGASEGLEKIEVSPEARNYVNELFRKKQKQNLYGRSN